MNTSGYFLIAFFMASVVACGQKKNPNTHLSSQDSTHHPDAVVAWKFEVDTFSFNGTDPQCKSKEGICSSCRLYYEKIKQPLTHLAVYDSVNVFIDSSLSFGLNEMSVPDGGFDLRKRANSFFKASKGYEEEGTGAWDWDLSIQAFAGVQEIISVRFSNGGYTGGAHPNWYGQTTGFWVSSGKKVELTDVFNDTVALNKITEKYFRKAVEIDETIGLNDAGFWFANDQFSVGKDFTITATDITFDFDPYEVAPYAAGAISVTVPLADLKKIMKVNFTAVD